MRYKLTDKVYLFVYGTLLNSQSNFYRLGQNAKLICAGSIRAKMFTTGSFPYIMFSNSSKNIVHGELYQLPYNVIINNIDRLEGYKINSLSSLYFRKKTIVNSNLNVKFNAFVYIASSFLHKTTHGNPIPSGNWKLPQEILAI
jgi:gamma-glutamylcyclotransferase (GGCT)/AIG2-like uncharacterized protein YtfP